MICCTPDILLYLYPRVRGANVVAAVALLTAIPLPPRARGKLPHGRNDLLPYPSTPACAGQTEIEDVAAHLPALYPRVRGANNLLYQARQDGRPLPPRARGKLCLGLLSLRGRPSTPACAGQTSR